MQLYPGSGKGTLCTKLISHFELSHPSMGDLLRGLREIFKENSLIANESHATMEPGALIDTDTV